MKTPHVFPVVLVVEADRSLSWLICESLRGAGHDCVECSPEQAVSLTADLPAGVIVAGLSTVAPEREPLYRALRGEARTKDIPLVLVTGRGDATVRRRLSSSDGS